MSLFWLYHSYRVRSNKASQQYQSFLICEILEGGENSKASSHLRNKAIASAMIRTWMACQTDAATFWIAVRDGEMLKKTMPADHLRTFWLTNRCRRDPGEGQIRAILDREYQYRCITAWNVFRGDGKMVNPKYYPTHKVPAAR